MASGEAGRDYSAYRCYHVDTSRGTVTFLIHSGHAAFTKMRARGRKVTDIVVLIVQLMTVSCHKLKKPFTREEANVPMVVAINKIDKPQADVDRVLNDPVSSWCSDPGVGWGMFLSCASQRNSGGNHELLDAILRSG